MTQGPRLIPLVFGSVRQSGGGSPRRYRRQARHPVFDAKRGFLEVCRYQGVAVDEGASGKFVKLPRLLIPDPEHRPRKIIPPLTPFLQVMPEHLCQAQEVASLTAEDQRIKVQAKRAAANAAGETQVERRKLSR